MTTGTLPSSSVTYPASPSVKAAPSIPLSDAEKTTMSIALERLGIKCDPSTAYKVMIPEGCTLDTSFIPHQGGQGVTVKLKQPDEPDTILKIGYQNSDPDIWIREVEATKQAINLLPEHTVSKIDGPYVMNFPIENSSDNQESFDQRLCTISPYAGTSLLDIAGEMDKESPKVSLKIFVNTLLSMIDVSCQSEDSGLHHHDVKIDNLLVDENGVIRWIDWESALWTQPTYYTGRWYRSPESLMKGKEASAFFFSSACILFQLVTNAPLFYSSFLPEDKDRHNHMLVHLTNVARLIPPTEDFIHEIPEDVRKNYFEKKEDKYQLKTPVSLDKYELGDFTNWDEVDDILKKVQFDKPSEKLQEFPKLFREFLQKCLDYTKPISIEEFSEDPFVKMMQALKELS